MSNRPNNAQKLPLARTLPLFVQEKIQAQLDLTGQAIPGHVIEVDGSIVTISFDLQNPDGSSVALPTVTMPVFGPTYIRYPIQQGDLGVAFPADFYLGGVSGLGGGTADTTPRGNLSCLVWFPCGNKNWTAPEDPNALELYGPNGVILHDTAGASTETISGGGIELNTSGVNATENLSVGNGWSGVFGTPTGQTVTVVAGIIVNVA